VTLAIMQPYFLPYIGYFQLIRAVDRFVIYDNIKYTKRGWINRNRILLEGHDELFTLPLKNDSDSLNIDQRFLSDSYDRDASKTLRKISVAYRKAPFFEEVMPIIEQCFTHSDRNLFRFNYHAVKLISKYLDIATEFIISSTVDIDHSLAGEEKVLAICRSLHADTYINAIGGQELYTKETFQSNEIHLKFIKTGEIVYPQLDGNFIPHLSIVDVLMFNKKETIKEYLQQYTLV
jgi:hypothetical protein